MHSTGNIYVRKVLIMICFSLRILYPAKLPVMCEDRHVLAGLLGTLNRYFNEYFTGKSKGITQNKEDDGFQKWQLHPADQYNEATALQLCSRPESSQSVRKEDSGSF